MDWGWRSKISTRSNTNLLDAVVISIENSTRICKDRIVERKDKMMKELLNIIRMNRLDHTLNKALMKRSEYIKNRETEQRHWQYVLKINLSKEQFLVLNRYLDAQNCFSAYYGEVAYELGLKDGVNLAREMRELEELPFS